MTRPTISIITPCLNRAQFVGAAVESVLEQGYPELEHIIMDGGSTDGTLDLLRKYPHLRLVSEPDNGMYDAINKGIHLARGEIVGLLNTDDLYAPGALESVAEVFEQNPEVLAVAGGVTKFVEDESGFRVLETIPAIEPHEFWFRVIQGHPATNAWFFRREVFERLGGFDVRMRWSADRYFLIRIAIDGGVRPVPVRRVLYQYRQHSGSATITTLDSRDPRYGPLRIEILQEDISALDELLHRKDLPREVRRRTCREHSQRCYRLSATAAYHRQWRIAARAASWGWRRDLLWPLVFVEMAMRRLVKEFRGRDE